MGSGSLWFSSLCMEKDFDFEDICNAGPDLICEISSKYGEITDSVIMIDKHSGRPRGFGFVTFADQAVADKVLEEDHVIDGRTIEVKRTVPREDMEVKGVSKTTKIFVGGIPPSLTDGELKDYFSSYGSIIEHQIMLDHKTGRSRGFGFVTFDSEEAVENIFVEGKMHELGGKKVEIKKAEPKRAGGGYRGSATKSYGGFGNSAAGYDGYNPGGRGNGKMDRGYSGYDTYGAYGGYGENYGGGSASFYAGYGAYGYGFGYGAPMYGTAGYGIPVGYGGPAGYGGSRGYGGFGSSSYDDDKGYERDGSSLTRRYHPYQK
ncbi:Heterogeneous nuclear ribonucleoprotein 1 [Morella rubra]|uniref:Heterogeneous nuclear ribonucleoprotein 1 n=1 Tax=Morella rubra TaxID=262757 RepID=A0A6A1W0I9_9ROSI|nr:Heterogeneous nuclear ribonucleoprotein 1 [Morella rubra]